MNKERVDLAEVFRDKDLLEDIRSEVRKQALTKWRPWELLLPPDLLWPMIEEVSQGRVSEWCPVVDGIGVQVGEQGEISIRFVLEDLKISPVKRRVVPYIPPLFVEHIEVRRGKAWDSASRATSN